MLQMYEDLSKNRRAITTPFIYGAGAEDTLVNPQAGQRFFDEVCSTDKEYASFPGIWHNVFIEAGNEVVRARFAQWLAARLPIS
mmetsp:Transcript_15218/g.37625  ORF Transcript_15218/g.37625 Transcript_15218/m.37625 type:complete len:84 (+) Transcript_15218:69-320(+)